MQVQDDKLRQDIAEFLQTYYQDEIARLAQRYPNEQQSLVIDWSDVLAYDPDIADDVRNYPDTMGEYFDTALLDIDLPVDTTLGDASVRFTNVGDAISVTDLRAEHVNQLLGVSGQVSKTTPIRPRFTVAAFECERCAVPTRVAQPAHGSVEPRQCSGCERNGPLQPLWEQSETVPHQLIRLKTPPEDANDGDEWLDVHLTGDAVGTVQAGQRVDIYGVLEPDIGDFETPIPEFYMIGHVADPHDSDYQSIDIDEHKEEFEAIANGERGDPYKKLIESIAPSISGGEKMRDIKLAIAFQQFGGWRRQYNDGRYARGDSHICLIGDPGTGKSSLLDAIEEISPRSAFTSGKNTTAAGLTAAAVPDDFGDQEWSLEAGAIVKANKGVACVDEIDKVDESAVSSLHTALEKQIVPVNKAGISATLPARTALLAAGNPKYGRFDRNEPDAQQLNLDPAFASRFDLIYTLKDQPNPDRDEDLAEHILRTRQISGKVARGDIDADDERTDLIAPEIPKDTLRAWIAYARENYHPVIEDDDVIEALTEYFVGIRSSSDDTVPLTARKLDAILRLAEASARVRLSNEITLDDIERAKRVVGRSLADIGINEDGEFDADIHELGQSAPQSERIKKIMDALEVADEPLTVAEITKRTTLNNTDAVEHDIENLLDASEVYSEGHDEGFRPV